MSNAAEKSLLERLHNALAAELIKAVKEGVPLVLPNGDPVVDAEGRAVFAPAPAAVLNQVRQFLKDNDIKCSPTGNTPAEELGKAVNERGITLPFEGSEATH